MIPGTRQGSESNLGPQKTGPSAREPALCQHQKRDHFRSSQSQRNRGSPFSQSSQSLCNPTILTQCVLPGCNQVYRVCIQMRSILPLDRSQTSNGKVRLSKIFAILMQSKNLHTFGEHNVPWNKEQGGCQLQRSETILDSALAERRREWSEHPTSGRKSNGNRDRETTRQS